MVDFTVPAEVFIYILDLFGTMAFAVTGAFKAIESKADIVGIVKLTAPVIIPVIVIKSVVQGVLLIDDRTIIARFDTLFKHHRVFFFQLSVSHSF